MGNKTRLQHNQRDNQRITKPLNAPALWLFSGLLSLVLMTTALVLKTTWHDSLGLLFARSQSLTLAQMVAQLQILPTMLVTIFAGGLLGVVSVLLQQLVKNTLASDSTLAVGTGAQLALLIVTLFFPNFGLYGSFWVAFIGALLSMGLVFAIAANSRMNPVVLILGGLVVNILFSAISSLLMIFFSERVMGVMAWESGNLTQTSWQNSQFFVLISLILPIILLFLVKPLTIMSLDERQAKALGVPVAAVRMLVVTLVAVVTASVVSRVGVLSFVGLAAASVVNVVAIRPIGQRLMAGFAFGAMLLWLTNNVVMLLSPWFKPLLNITLPVGSVTGILGAGLIIWLVIRQSKQPMIAEQSPSLLASKRRYFGGGFWAVSVGLLLLVTVGVLGVSPDAMGSFGWHTEASFIENFRLPRTLSAMATGVMLATAGVLLQNLTRNPMASPEVMGISSGAALGVVLVFLLSPVILGTLGLATDSFWALGLPLLGGLLGAGLVLLLVLWLARRLSSSYLLLVGVAISALMGGMLTLIKLSGDPRLQAMLNWLSGTTYHAYPVTAWALMVIGTVLFLLSFLLLKPLRVISLDETMARSLGVSVKRSEILIFSLVAVLSTVSTLAVGPLSFIGLMTPHLAKTLGAVQLPHQLALSALLGAGLMLVADWMGRYAIFPYEIPAGTIASIIGGLYFLWLMKGMNN